MKIGDGTKKFENITGSGATHLRELVTACSAANIDVFGYHVPWCKDLQGAKDEAAFVAKTIDDFKLAGAVVDNEDGANYFKGDEQTAKAYGAALQAQLRATGKLVLMSSNDFPSIHKKAYAEIIGQFIDVNAPQVYYGQSPSVDSRLNRAIRENKVIHKPFFPVGAAFIRKPSDNDGGFLDPVKCGNAAGQFIRLVSLLHHADPDNYPGYAFWNWEEAPKEVWDVLNATDVFVAPDGQAASASEFTSDEFELAPPSGSGSPSPFRVRTVGPAAGVSMNSPCPFDQSHLSFVGSPVEQARCLLRFVKRQGNVDNTPATLPPLLNDLLAAPQTVDVTKAQLRSYLRTHGIPESTVGGSVDDPVCRADTNNPSARLAQYFVIHDTSTKLHPGETFDPNFINTARWAGNKLSTLPRGKTHIYITRLGETLTDADYRTRRRATQFELHPSHTLFRGLFLHHELVQPRMGPGHSDADSPDPGFTQVQYERLALQYLLASVRRGSWMIPAFHCVLDLHVGDHDDPQHFDLAAWGSAPAAMLAAVRGDAGAHALTMALPPAKLRSKLLAGDPVLQQIAAGNQVLAPSTMRSVAGVGPLQDALNLLADQGRPGLNIAGARPGRKSRGFYGKQTAAAVTLFQTLRHLTPDSTTGRDTILALDADLLALEAPDEQMDATAPGAATGTFKTPPAHSRTKDGTGGSTTTGLDGQITQQAPGEEIIDASETLTAFRDGHSLGAARRVRQVRKKHNGVTVVEQPDYCWGRRQLLGAELVESYPGFGDDPSVFKGKATFFGKSDSEDEGTGTGAFGTVQTDSSVFGVSLKRARLLAEGLVTENAHHVLHPTDKGLHAIVEVFFPHSGRLVRLPLVDVGPGTTGPAKTAVADLTVAATAFLQKLTEDDIKKLDNIQVHARIVA